MAKVEEPRVKGCLLNFTVKEKTYKCGSTRVCTGCGWTEEERRKRLDRIEAGHFVRTKRTNCKRIVVDPPHFNFSFGGGGGNDPAAL